ncbi:MAG: amidinotransferase [bacterium]|nr:amidinotransferase [bacterium]
MSATNLGWGHHYLMCPPDHFTVEYAINPWMTADEPVDPKAARDQWGGLVGAIETAGGKVSTITPDPDLPDMVFTANAGIMADGVFAPARMRFAERAREPQLAAQWAAGAGYEVAEVGAATFEGMGDALPFRDRLIAGYGQRTKLRAWSELSENLGWDFTPIELRDPRFYHIDIVFSPLNDRSALVAPSGLTSAGLRTIKSVVPDPILLTDDEAQSFSANSIVVGETVISPAASPRLRRELERRGFTSVIAPVDEFLKAGGAVRCLTLPLDIELGVELAQIA